MSVYRPNIVLFSEYKRIRLTICGLSWLPHHYTRCTKVGLKYVEVWCSETGRKTVQLIYPMNVEDQIGRQMCSPGLLNQSHTPLSARSHARLLSHTSIRWSYYPSYAVPVLLTMLNEDKNVNLSSPCARHYTPYLLPLIRLSAGLRKRAFLILYMNWWLHRVLTRSVESLLRPPGFRTSGLCRGYVNECLNIAVRL